VADVINKLAVANNDTALRNYDFPALWQKRASGNGAALNRAAVSPRAAIAISASRRPQQQKELQS
jgi:hypothetical protein